MFDNSELFMADEDTDGFGYTCSKNGSLVVFALFWAKNCKTKSVCYPSLHDFYEKSCIYIESELIHHTPLHHAKYKMCKAYIDYYYQHSST